MKYKTEDRPPNVREYQQLRTTTGWDPVTDQAVEQAMRNTEFGVCILHENEIVGTGRIIGDGIYYYIQDVIVMPEFQGQGVGKLIMDELGKWLNERTDTYAFVGLMAAKGTTEFYQGFDFQKRPEEGPGMFKIVNKDGAN